MKKKIKRYLQRYPSLYRGIRLIYDHTFLQYIVFKKRRYFKQHASTVFRRLNEALKESGCVFWLDYGTLLGAVREKNFIPHDNDIDIGILGTEETIRKKVEQLLQKAGFNKKHYFRYKGIVWEETYEYRGISVDLFYYRKVDETQMESFCFLCLPDRTREETIAIRGGLVTAKSVVRLTGTIPFVFLGVSTFAPDDPIGYVINIYGEDYKVPKEQWNNLTDPCNMTLIEDEFGEYIRV